MDDEALLAFLDVKPAYLPPAPAAPTREEYLARIEPVPVPEPCAVCGAPAWLTRTVATTAGRRWLDLCRPHRLAASEERRKRLPDAPVGETLAVLQEAAEECGLRMRVIVSRDMAGWPRD